MRARTAILCLSAIVAIALVQCQKADPASRQPQARIVDSQELLKVLGQAKGSVVVMNFWATWCQPCIDETPELIKFYQEWTPKKIVFISVSVDHPDTTQERVVPFLKEKGVPFPVYVLKDRSPDAVGKTLGVEWEGGVPATFVFDKGGQLRKSWFEEITPAELEGSIAPLQ